MTVDIWFRDPHMFVRDALANGYRKFVYDRRWCATHKLDPVGWLRQKTLGIRDDAELLLVGPQGAGHYDVWSSFRQPKAVYPTWRANLQPIEDLVDLIENPVGEMDEAIFEDLPEALRPTRGQKHMIVIMDLPNMAHGYSKSLMREVSALAASYPDCTLHLNGSDNFPSLFNYGMKSVDFDPAHGNRIFLPNGIVLLQEDTPEWPAYVDWIKFLGFAFAQVARNKQARKVYNMESVHWAAKYWNNEYRYNMRYKPNLNDQNQPNADYVPGTNKLRNSRQKNTIAQRSLLLKEDGRTDFMLCNGCIYRTTCKLMRADAVCSYEGTDTVGLAESFGTRNADTIIDGLNKLLSMQATRLEAAAAGEADTGEIDPEVTKMMNSLFKNGVSLAKLIDPTLNGKGVNVNVGIVNAPAAGAIAAVDPRQLVAKAVAALESQGIKREEITEDMIRIMLTQQVQPEKKAIEGTVVKGD